MSVPSSASSTRRYVAIGVDARLKKICCLSFGHWSEARPRRTAAWAARLGMNLMSSTLVEDDVSGEPSYVVQARHIPRQAAC